MLMMVRQVQVVLLHCLHRPQPHQLEHVVLFMVGLGVHGLDIDQLVLADEAVHAVFILGITELFTIRSRLVRSVVNEHLFAQAVQVDLPIGAEAVDLVCIYTVEVAHVVVMRKRLQLRVAEANILNILGQHFLKVRRRNVCSL